MGLFGLFESSKSESTSNNTTNNNYDQRQVNDAGGGIVGTGNTLVSTDGGAFDLVRGAAADITAAGNNTTNGAIALAMQAQQDAAGFNMGAMGRTFDLAGATTSGAFKSSSDAMGLARESFSTVADLARSVVSQAGQQASQAAATASGAYQSAADTATGNKTVIYVGLAVVGLVAAVFVFKKAA